MINWTGTESATVLLAPPSPPGAPHMGSLYTWALLDATRRTIQHLGGTCRLPQSWNMSSRRLEPIFGSDPEGFQEYSRAAIAETVAALAKFGITMSPTIALRDDLADVKAHIRALVTDMAENGTIRYIAAEEKWCLDCQLALPPTSAASRCFKCQRPLTLRTTSDWFLQLDLDQIFQRAEVISWHPPYAIRRLKNLRGIHPLIRVNHAKRTLGVPSPFRDGDIVDPRVAGALGPSVLRRLGVTGPITAMSGFDIQRKWLLTLLAANGHDALPVAVVNHGTLLDTSGRKLSRYSGATLADVPKDVHPCVVRAALLSAPLGKDLHAAELPTAGASRLRQKTGNCLRFLRMQVPTDANGVDLDAELEAPLRGVEEHLRECDPARGYAAFRHAITHQLSSVLIPAIRRNGLSRHTQLNRIASLHQIFFGDDPLLREQGFAGAESPSTRQTGRLSG